MLRSRSSPQPVEISGDDFAASFREQFGRDPTDADISDLVGRITTYHRPGDPIQLDDKADFNARIGETLSIADVPRAILSQIYTAMHAEEEGIVQQAQERKQARRKQLKRLGKIAGIAALASVALGAVGGVGVATYTEAHSQLTTTTKAHYAQLEHDLEEQYRTQVVAIEAKTQQRIDGLQEVRNAEKREYTEKTRDLNNKFFGPLETLAQASAPSMLPAEYREESTQIYFQLKDKNFIPDGISPHTVLYDQHLGKNRIVALSLDNYHFTKSPIDVADTSTGWSRYLMILKLDAQQGVLAAHLYENSAASSKGKTYSSARPLKSILFHGDQYNELIYGSYQHLFTYAGQGIEEHTIFSSDRPDVITPYFEQAMKVLQDMETLEARGPNGARFAR